MPKIPIDAEKRISSEFKQRVLDLIDDSEFNKKQFAKEMGISGEVVSRITIYGIIPSLKTLLKIADYYEISLSYLLAETEENDFIMSNNKISFFDSFEMLLKENKLKYSEFVKSMPFTENFIYEWRREGTLPSLEYLTAIADYFKVTRDYLLGRTDYRK